MHLTLACYTAYKTNIYRNKTIDSSTSLRMLCGMKCGKDEVDDDLDYLCNFDDDSDSTKPTMWKKKWKKKKKIKPHVVNTTTAPSDAAASQPTKNLKRAKLTDAATEHIAAAIRLGLPENSKYTTSLLRVYNRNRQRYRRLMRKFRKHKLLPTEIGDIGELAVALSLPLHFRRNDLGSMHTLDILLGPEHTVEKWLKTVDNNGYDIIQAKFSDDGTCMLSGFFEVKNHKRTKLTPDHVMSKAGRFMTNRNAIADLGDIEYGIKVGRDTVQTKDVSMFAEEIVSNFQTNPKWSGTNVKYQDISVMDFTDTSKFLFEDMSTADLTRIAKEDHTSSEPVAKYVARPWVSDRAVPTYRHVLSDVQKGAYRDCGSYREMMEHMLHINAGTGAGKTAAIFELMKDYHVGTNRYMIVLDKRDDYEHFVNEASTVFGREIWATMKTQLIMDRSTPASPDADIVFLVRYSAQARNFAELPADHFTTVFIDEAHKMQSSVIDGDHTQETLYRKELLLILKTKCSCVAAVTATPKMEMIQSVPEQHIVCVTHKELVACGANVKIFAQVLRVSKNAKTRAYQQAHRVLKSGHIVSLVVSNSIDGANRFREVVKQLDTNVDIYQRYGGQNGQGHDDLPMNFSKKSIIITIQEDIQATDRRQISLVFHLDEQTVTSSLEKNIQVIGRGTRVCLGKMYMDVMFCTTQPTGFPVGLQRVLSGICVHAGFENINGIGLDFISAKTPCEMPKETDGEQEVVVEDVVEDDDEDVAADACHVDITIMREELQKVWEIVTTEIKKDKNGGDRTSLPSTIAPVAPPMPKKMSQLEKLWKVDEVLVLRAKTARPGEIVTIRTRGDDATMVFEGTKQPMGTFLKNVKTSKNASHVELRTLVLASDSEFSQVFKTLLSTKMSQVEKLRKVDEVLVLRAKTAKPGEIVTIGTNGEDKKMVFEGSQQKMGVFLHDVKSRKHACFVKWRALVLAPDSEFSQVFKTLLSTNLNDKTQECLEWLRTFKRAPKYQSLNKKSPKEKVRCRPENIAFNYLMNNYFKLKNPRKPTLCEEFRVFPFIVDKFNTLKGTAITVTSTSSSSSSSLSSI